MTSYTDLFVVPVPTGKRDAYRDLAETSAKVWKEHGALSYVEVEADDAKAGKWTSFPQSVDLKDGEFVVVAIITYRSREHRDEVNAKAMKDPRMAGMDPKTMPFDAKRMFWGGFKPFSGAPQAPAVQPYLFFRGRCEYEFIQVLSAWCDLAGTFQHRCLDLSVCLLHPGYAQKLHYDEQSEEGSFSVRKPR